MHICDESVSSITSPDLIVRLRPPATAVASRIVQLYPSRLISKAAVIPAIPPPKIVTVLPAPALPGQSPGRGDCKPPAGGGGGGGGGGPPPPGADCAEDDPHAASDVLIPIAAIVRNIAEPPTALPIAVRNSRRAIRFSLLLMFSHHQLPEPACRRLSLHYRRAPLEHRDPLNLFAALFNVISELDNELLTKFPCPLVRKYEECC